jgi:hypothetical protein
VNSRCRSWNPIAAIAIAMALIAACGGGEPTERQAAVAEAGGEVMPFDLDSTTHIFTETDNGGTQEVIADDPSDDESVRQIRQHLSEEANNFSVGDFSDPESIHGPAMPGLATLKSRFAEIDISVDTTESGALITYTSDEAELVDAIHDWFAAQKSDHGQHAEHDMSS